jgi:hypothetical protein
MMALGFLAATSITAYRMKELGLDPDLATTLLYCMLGGVSDPRSTTPSTRACGRRAMVVAVLLPLRADLVRRPDRRRRRRRARLSVHGSRSACTWRRSRSAPRSARPIGQVGCFLVGDDYGRETDLPWGIAFPQGAPPTLAPSTPPSSETVWLLAVAAFLAPAGAQPLPLREYMILNGSGGSSSRCCG